MGQATSQIEAHIEDTRADLGSNLKELEQKVRSVTNWKRQFQKNPMTILGVAFGGGIVLAKMLEGRKNKRGSGDSYNTGAGLNSHAGTDRQKHRVLDTWDNIQDALIGVAAARFTDFVGEIVPGFHEQFQRTAEKAKTIRPGTS